MISYWIIIPLTEIFETLFSGNNDRVDNYDDIISYKKT